MGTAAALALRFADDEPLTRELLAAEIDGSFATAVHDADPLEWRVFYPSADARDAACAALAGFCRAHGLTAMSIDVGDEDWARRSQATLTAIRIGDIVVAPPWDIPQRPEARDPGTVAHSSGLRSPASGLPVVIVIEPSTGFGTGHHASTRLCLMAMQGLDLRGRRVIDVGTGSGVLAIAAAKLGAGYVLAIDTDADAIQNARENVARNSVAIDLRVADAATLGVEPADVVLANLTAAWLRRLAERLSVLAQPGGTLVLSGLQDWEQPSVLDGFAGRTVDPHSESDEGWTAVTLKTIR